MITVDVMGSREEWLQARTSHIGGSDAAAVIGQNPWMTNVELWEIKTGRRKQPDISDAEAVRYGTEAERHLRDLFRLDFPDLEVGYDENNIWTNDQYPWAHASLDGLLKDRTGALGILEIKTTTIRSRSGWDKWDGQIPQNYYCQILWYLAVTGADFAVLKAQIKYTKDDTLAAAIRHYFFQRNEVREDIDYLMTEAGKFYWHIKNDVRPALILPEV